MLGSPDNTKWYIERITPDLVQLTSIKGVVFSGKSKYQAVEVLESGCFGRSLVLDGKTQSSQADEFIYHQSLVHPAMLAHPNPRAVCIAGGGEGATAREVLRHNTVERAVMIDLDAEVVDLCRKYLPGHHQGAFDDPRLDLQISDASAYLLGSPELFDVIVLDLPDPLEGGPAYLLYTTDFYRMLRGKLNPGGLLVTQSGPASVINYTEVFTAIHRTLREIFPTVTPYSVHMQSFGETWGFNIASLGPDPAALTPAAVDARLAERGIAPLDFYDGIMHTGLFAIPPYIRAALAAEERIITADNPIFVY